MDASLKEILAVVQGGGNLALVVAVYFIIKATHQLAELKTAIYRLIDRIDGRRHDDTD